MLKPVPFVYKVSAIIIMILAVFFAYRNHFNNPFEFDDEHSIVNNHHIRSLQNIPHFFKDGTTMSSLPANQSYRPGLTTLNAIDYWLGGQEQPISFYYHRSIFISFVILLICIHLFAVKIFESSFTGPQSFWLSIITATIYGVHAANTETINYIIQRADSFSTLMVVAGFVVYLYLPKFRRFYFYMLPPIVGFLVKEPAIMFVPLLFVYKILFEHKDFSQTWFKLNSQSSFIKVSQQLIIPFGITAGMYLFSTQMTPENWTPGGNSRIHYLFTQPYVILHYFNNFIVPSNLTIDTDWTPVKRLLEDRVIIGFGFIGLLLFVIVSCISKHRIISFGLLWFLITLIPTSSIFPLAEVLNDHRPFFGYIGLSICLVYLMGRIYHHLQKRSSFIIAYSLLFAFIICHALGTRYRNEIWSSSESIWREATIKSPNNGRAWMNYGNTLLAKGDLQGAEKSYEEAKKLWPYYSYLYINMGILKSTQNKPKEAEDNFKYALQCDWSNPACYSYYGNFLFKQRRYKEAETLANRGLQISPQHSMLLSLKNILQPHLNNISDGKTPLDAAIETAEKNPSPENFIQLSLEYYNNQQFNECIDACNKALKLKPDYDLAYNNICSAYIQLGEWTLAVNACEKGLEINPTNELLKGNLNLARNKKKQ